MLSTRSSVSLVNRGRLHQKTNRHRNGGRIVLKTAALLQWQGGGPNTLFVHPGTLSQPRLAGAWIRWGSGRSRLWCSSKHPALSPTIREHLWELLAAILADSLSGPRGVRLGSSQDSEQASREAWFLPPQTNSSPAVTYVWGSSSCWKMSWLDGGRSGSLATRLIVGTRAFSRI